MLRRRAQTCSKVDLLAKQYAKETARLSTPSLSSPVRQGARGSGHNLTHRDDDLDHLERYLHLQRHLRTAFDGNNRPLAACNETELTMVVSGANIDGHLMIMPHGGVDAWAAASTGDQDSADSTTRYATTSMNPRLIEAIKKRKEDRTMPEFSPRGDRPSSPAKDEARLLEGAPRTSSPVVETC